MAASNLDVAVVGAGPAGAWAAYHLARAGARVAIFDPSHPREKPCGGGVTGRALEIVSGAIDLRELERTVITSARFGEARVPLAAGALSVVSRATFDAALLTAAAGQGAVIERSRVADVAFHPDHVTVKTSRGDHRASFVVGADGVNSLVRRRVLRPFDRGQLSLATGFYARPVSSDEMAIEFVPDPPGYIWSFPRPGHLAIGICAQADDGATAGPLRGRAAEWVWQTGLAHGAALAPYSWPIPSLNAADFERMAFGGERWMLVGDAAGLVDPITREGIFFALESGAAAASALADGSTSRGYRARIEREILPELGRAARLKAAFFTPPFLELLEQGLQRNAAIRAVMADLVAGRQPYRTLKWRLLQTLDVGLAWRALRERAIRRAFARGRRTRKQW